MKHIIAIIALFVLLTAVPANALNRPGTKFAKFINHSRVINYVQPLKINKTLTHYAVLHTKEMIETSSLYHSSFHFSGCSVWGENVGVGSKPWELHQAFMASIPHRQNILSPYYHSMGIGARRDIYGRLWVTEIFCG